MSKKDDSPPRPRPRGEAIMIQELPVGSRLKLKSGAEVEIVENPRDGSWLYAKRAGAEEADLVFADDVLEVLE
jgi:hypothetical protein